MDQTVQQDLIDLGDAKELTKGIVAPELTEDNPAFMYRDE